MALTTKAIIKSDWLKIASGDTTQDALIDRLIAASDAEIKAICGQPIEQTAVIWDAVGTRTNTLRSPYTAPHVITAIQTRLTPAEAWVTVPSSYFFQRRGAWYAYNETPFSNPYYKLLATLGYTTIPAEVVLCANELVTELYNTTPMSDMNRFGVSSISEAAGGTTITKALQSVLSRIRQRLAPYMRVSI